MATVFMMVGLPGSGKSTFVNSFFQNEINNPVNKDCYISTDAYIEERAKALNKTYSEVFQEFIDEATNHCEKMILSGISLKKNLIIDQTNLTAKIRRYKLKLGFASYYKIAIVVETPKYEEHHKRLISRPGKSIPGEVMKRMMNNFEFPTFSEGWDEVWIYNSSNNMLFKAKKTDDFYS